LNAGLANGAAPDVHVPQDLTGLRAARSSFDRLTHERCWDSGAL
jgi:hypothetical protein